MNLVQLANDLEFVPKEQLAEMSQDPNSRFPSYLVLSEIQRRTQNEKAYAAAQPQPTTTVAEEVVGEFMQPQGLQAGMPPESAPTDVFSSGMSGMPASAPMQMANGGLTGYANRGKTKVGPPKPISPESVLKETQDEIKNVSRRAQTFSPKYDLAKKLYKKGIIDYEAFVKALRTETDTLILGSELGAFSPEWGRGKDIYRSNDSLQAARDASRNEMRQRQMGMAGGGLTSYAAGNRTSLSSSFDDPFSNVGGAFGTTGNPNPDGSINAEKKGILKERYTKEDGSIDYGTAILDGVDATMLGLILAPEPVTSAVGTVGRTISGLSRLAMGAIRNPGQYYRKLAEKIGTKKIDAGKIQNVGPNAVNPNLTVPFAKTNIAKDVGSKVIKTRAGRTAGAVYLGSKALPEGEEEVVEDKKDEEDKSLTEDTTVTTLSDYQALLRKNAEKAERKDRGYDLAQLGGLIMGSKNLGDLGMGIAGMAQQKQTRADTLKSEESKDAYYRASANKIQAEIDALPLEKTQSLLDSVLKVLENEDGLLTEEQIINYGIYRDNLQLKLLKSEGIDLSATGINALDAARI